MIKRVKDLGPNALIKSPEFRDYVEKFESEINRGISTLCILSVIKRAGDAGVHGYSLLKQLEEDTKDMLVIEEGTLYPLLKKLEKQNILISDKKIVEGRMRKTYKMTKNGEKIYNHLSGFYGKLTEAISPLLDLDVHLEERFLYCPNCANKIDLDIQDINFCEICGNNITELRERRLN